MPFHSDFLDFGAGDSWIRVWAWGNEEGSFWVVKGGIGVNGDWCFDGWWGCPYNTLEILFCCRWQWKRTISIAQLPVSQSEAMKSTADGHRVASGRIWIKNELDIESCVYMCCCFFSFLSYLPIRGNIHKRRVNIVEWLNTMTKVAYAILLMRWTWSCMHLIRYAEIDRDRQEEPDSWRICKLKYTGGGSETERRKCMSLWICQSVFVLVKGMNWIGIRW